jgi:hypothetical protein
MKPRNRREALVIMSIRRNERRMERFKQMAGTSVYYDYALNIADCQRQIDAATARLNSGYYLDESNFELSDDEQVYREEARQTYSFQIED